MMTSRWEKSAFQHANGVVLCALAGVAAAVALVMSVAVSQPVAAYAQEPASGLQAVAQKPATGSEGLATQVTKYNIWVGNKRVTSANKNNVLGNGTVKYNPKTNTLTLNKAKIKKVHVEKTASGSTYNYGIYSKQKNRGLTIELKGKSTISVPGKGTVSSYAIGLNNGSGGAMNLTIKGSGSLKAKAGKAGLFSYGVICQNLNILGSANVTLSGGTKVATSNKPAAGLASYVGSCGATVFGILSLHDSAKLTATGKTRALSRAVSYSQNYTPLVKAGSSASSLKVNQLSPAASVYTSYKYVSISKAKASKPAKMKITKVTPLGSGFSVEYKTVKKNCTGYEIQLTSLSSGKSWTYKTSNTSMNKATFSNLTGGAKYSVRIRAVNTVGSKTSYGAWSAKKTVTTYQGQPAG